MFTTSEEAQAAYEALQAYDGDNASEVPPYEDKRSQLSSIVEGQLPVEADSVVFALEQGVLSQPVQTALGWHIFKV
ncbi:hypothetical protein GN156_36245, partial [bacterium LRH843]|nr:hypothetical protein [bacterium LRH843]